MSKLSQCLPQVLAVGTKLVSRLVACNLVCLLAWGQKRKSGSPETDEYMLR